MRSLMFEDAMKAACERYRPAGRLAYHFARGKLRGDPVYRALFEGGWLPGDGVLLDLGCGGGLLLALVAEARRRGGPAPRLIGVETRPGAVAVARTALGGEAEILTGDVRTEALPPARAIALLDVLSMMPAADQDALLRVLVAALEPGGVLLVRDVDAGAGWRFRTVAVANRFKAWALRTRGVRFHFRTLDGWRAWLGAAGLAVESRPMGRGTPFANVLLIARKPPLNPTGAADGRR
jgi:SAM-dependent methyltransferase